jgi:hypothetical protein
MKISHDPKMQIVSRVSSDVEFPMLNKAAHDVKEGFRRTSADVCKNGRTESTQHAYDKAGRNSETYSMHVTKRVGPAET